MSPHRTASQLEDRQVLMDEVALGRALRRMLAEILEQAGPDVYLVGIRTGGALLAERMARAMAADPEFGGSPTLGAVDITLYRDDALIGLPKPEVGATELPEPVDGRLVVLVDDVLYTGRTVRAAMDVLLDYGRPRGIRLAALVDRGCRELPIQPDFVGLRMQTSREQDVRVYLTERDSRRDSVVLREKKV